MGNYSEDPRDVLNRNECQQYVGIHIEQGVPLLDRDLNLLHDLLASAIRTTLRDHIGDGVAEAGGTAFRIVPVDDSSEDFLIEAGDPPPGRLLVDGVWATIQQNKRYTAQGTHPPLPTFDHEPSHLVYLDCWSEEITGAEDERLLNRDDLGIQTSVREVRRWLVRVAGSDEMPMPGKGHSHVALASRWWNSERHCVEYIDRRPTGVSVAWLASQVRRGMAPSFTAPGSQIHPTVVVGDTDTPVILSGRNLENADEVWLEPGGVGLSALVGAGPGRTPGTLALPGPAGARGVCRVRVETEFGTAVTDDTVTVLGYHPMDPLGPDLDGDRPVINSSGEIAGNLGHEAILWAWIERQWRLTTLPRLDLGQSSRACGIDDLGHVIGYCGGAIPMVWTLGTPVVTRALPHNPTFPMDFYRVAPNGLAAYHRLTSRYIDDGRRDGGWPATVWWIGASEAQQLPNERHDTTPFACASITGIASTGDAVFGGGHPDETPWTVPVVWRVQNDDWTCHELPRQQDELEWTLHAAAGDFVVGSTSVNGTTRAVVWQFDGGTWRRYRDFADLGDVDSSEALIVNAAGVVAGTTRVKGTDRMFVWDANTCQLLDRQFVGLRPAAVTDDGQVLANGRSTPSIWTPQDGLIPGAPPGERANIDAVSRYGAAIGRRWTEHGSQTVAWIPS